MRFCMCNFQVVEWGLAALFVPVASKLEVEGPSSLPPPAPATYLKVSWRRVPREAGGLLERNKSRGWRGTPFFPLTTSLPPSSPFYLPPPSLPFHVPFLLNGPSEDFW